MGISAHRGRFSLKSLDWEAGMPVYYGNMPEGNA